MTGYDGPYTEEKTLGHLIDETIRFYVDNVDVIKKEKEPQHSVYQERLRAIDKFVNNLQSELEDKINRHTHPKPISEMIFR